VAFGRFEIVADLLEVEIDRRAPRRSWFRLKYFQAMEAELTHPWWFPLHLGDLRDDLPIEPCAAFEKIPLGRVKIIFVDVRQAGPRYGGHGHAPFATEKKAMHSLDQSKND
jgi:hypothetical protein